MSTTQRLEEMRAANRDITPSYEKEDTPYSQPQIHVEEHIQTPVSLMVLFGLMAFSWAVLKSIPWLKMLLN